MKGKAKLVNESEKVIKATVPDSKQGTKTKRPSKGWRIHVRRVKQASRTAIAPVSIR